MYFKKEVIKDTLTVLVEKTSDGYIFVLVEDPDSGWQIFAAGQGRTTEEMISRGYQQITVLEASHLAEKANVKLSSDYD